ncbi:unnamed protein product [Periconia digitata]|uniref:Uncharacterized protein n=1 Tax=Periconia digitata TaxID=1303443 RepID=A0A9W4XTB2_9PLEO|nr:unnamed protein product [Periconia digitata]
MMGYEVGVCSGYGGGGVIVIFDRVYALLKSSTYVYTYLDQIVYATFIYGFSCPYISHPLSPRSSRQTMTPQKKRDFALVCWFYSLMRGRTVYLRAKRKQVTSDALLLRWSPDSQSISGLTYPR